MRVRRAVLILVAVTLLAGWSATAPSGTTTAELSANAESPQETTTADISENLGSDDRQRETTTAEESADDLPPGVNETGLEDPSELVDAHQAALNESGFAFEFQANVTVGPASQRTVQCGTVEAGLSPLVVESTSERDLGDGPTTIGTDLWANRTITAVRYDDGDHTRVRQFNRSGEELGVPDETWAHLPRADLDSQVTNAWLLELALNAGEFELDRVENRDGERVAVLRATEATAATNLTDLNATVVVDTEGRVHDISLTAAYEGDEADTSIHYEFELTQIGNVTVERPGWADAVLPDETTEDGTGDETTDSGGETADSGDETTEAGSGGGTDLPAPVST